MARKVHIIYAPLVYRDIKNLDSKVAKRILLKIEDNAIQTDPLARAKALTGSLLGRYRYRVGDYRVIFSVDAKGNLTILNILSIKHRKDAYR